MPGTWPRPSSAISRNSHPLICPSIDPSSMPSFTSSRPLPPTRSTRSSPSSTCSPAIVSKPLPENPLSGLNNRYHDRPLLCFVYVGLKQNCEALQLFRISELHELHFALSNGCGINRFREATIIDKTGWRLTLPGRPRCDGLFQNVGCDRDSSTCRHVKSIDAQEPGCQSHPPPGGRFEAFVHQP